MRVSLRDPASDKYVGDPANWEQAQAAILKAVQDLGMDYTVAEGEAAFYGPKLDFLVRDSIGREWQLGTVQVDYNLPERFQLEYIGEDGQAHRPVMIHRAPFGSLERFFGLLIEHFAGAFPVWMAPVQAVVIPIAERHQAYAEEVAATLRALPARVQVDGAQRDHALQDPRGADAKDPLHAGGGRQGKRKAAPSACARKKAATSAPCH